MEVLFADGTSNEIQMIRKEICCGCKVYDQDCLMKTEQEACKIHGLEAKDRTSQHLLIWKRFQTLYIYIYRRIYIRRTVHALRKTTLPYKIHTYLYTTTLSK